MAQVYGTIGTLVQLLWQFKKENITFINSLDDIISFPKEYDIRLANIKDETRSSIFREKENLNQKLLKTTNEYNAKIKEREQLLSNEKNNIDSLIKQYSVRADNIISQIFNSYKRYGLNKRKTVLFEDFEGEVRRPLQELGKQVSLTKQKIEYITGSFDKILQERAEENASKLLLAKKIIGENGPLISGAIGEHKTLDELKKLPDTYIIINNFRYLFERALHRKNTDDWIRSIQVDHLLIGPPGVLVIETKNWSDDSIQNLDLYSPVQQIQRTSYAVYMLLNRILGKGSSPLNHHWGPRQIPVNNIVVMTNRKPNQDFQYVKVLTLIQLNQYIRYQKSIFNVNEVRWIADVLLENYRFNQGVVIDKEQVDTNV